MIRKVFFATVLFLLTPLDAFAFPVQQISISNLLANTNATGGQPGATQTAVTIALNNGGSAPCLTSTLAYQASLNVSVGSGQSCVAPVTSITVTPIANSSGAVFAAPEPVAVNSSYFTTQITITDLTDPSFDTTNGLLVRQGTTQINILGQYRY